MWNLWLKSKTYNQLPSRVFGEQDSLAAWMLDSAVTWFGITIENALQESVKVVMGSNIEYKPRYTLALLLNPAFKLPMPLPSPQESSPFAAFGAWVGKKRSGVKRYRYKPPEPPVVGEAETING